MDGVIETAERAVFNPARGIRNPDDGNLDLFEEKVETAFFATVENDVGFVDEENRLLFLELCGGIKDAPHATAND